MTNVKSYILADKDRTGEFTPTEIVDNLEKLYVGLEYGDVAQGEFQVWEYPSGKIFDIKPDRTVVDSEYYSTPYSRGSTAWLPVCVAAGVDKARVTAAYKQLSSVAKAGQNKKRLLLKFFRRQK